MYTQPMCKDATLYPKLHMTRIWVISMSKLLPTVLVVTALLLSHTKGNLPAKAGTCASKCPPPPLGFIPGQRINVQVVNRTGGVILLFEKVQGPTGIPLRPGQELRFRRWTATEPNLSLMFWDVTSQSFLAVTSKPNADTLRIELRPGGRLSDRTLYILDDGRVTVF